MQKTKFDRWLRGKFAYITRVYTNTMPARVPGGIDVDQLDVESGAPYRYRFSSIYSKPIAALASQLETENITYTSRVEDRDVWYGKFINNPRKSFSYQLLWLGFFCSCLVLAFSPVPRMFWDFLNEEEGVVMKPKVETKTESATPKEKFAEWSGRFTTPKKK